MCLRGVKPQAGRHGVILELDTIMRVPPFLLLFFLAACASNQSDAVQVQVLAINDFHGNLSPPSGSDGRIPVGDEEFIEAGGAEYLATHLQALRKQQSHSVTVAAGDLIGASPLLSALFHDEPTIEALSQAGMDIAGVGNHEFDEGLTELLRMQNGGCHPIEGCPTEQEFKGASFSYLAANVTFEASGEHVLPPYEIRYFEGVPVSFIGLTLEGTPLVTSGWKGLNFADEADTVNTLVSELQTQGVEAFVVLLHEGGKTSGSYNGCEGGVSGALIDIVERFDPAVDVVVAGHTNAAHICPDISGKLVTSAASAGRLITDIRLRIDRKTGEVVGKSADNVIVDRTVPRDSFISKIIERYNRIAGPLINRLVGTANTDLPKALDANGESPLGGLVADAYLAAVQSPDEMAEIALVNVSGVRADLQKGPVSYGDLFALAPFGNTLVTMTLTGAELHNILENQFRADASGKINRVALIHSEGFFYRWVEDANEGNTVPFDSLSLDGKPINANQNYRVVTNNFLAEGGSLFSTFLSGTARVGGAVDLDAIEAFFAKRSGIEAPRPGRVQAVFVSH